MDYSKAYLGFFTLKIFFKSFYYGLYNKYASHSIISESMLLTYILIGCVKFTLK